MPTRRAFLLLPLPGLLGACATPAMHDSAPAADLPYALRRGLVYGSHARHRIDACLPAPDEGPQASARPVVVFFHGGAWRSGSRSAHEFVGAALASRGIVTLLVDHRLYPEVRYPDFLHDCAAAVAWAQRSASALGGDPARLFVMGHGTGAYNAAMLALDPRWLGRQGMSPQVLSGWIGLAGLYDFLPIVNGHIQPVFHHPVYPKDSQPLLYVRQSSPRAFLAAAPVDDRVDPRRNTQQMVRRLTAAGVPVISRVYEGTDHDTLLAALAPGLRSAAPVLDDIVAFVTT